MSLQAYLQPPPDGDTSTGPSILVITWLFTSISTIIVGLKVWTRLKIIGEFGADDILTILALVRTFYPSSSAPRQLMFQRFSSFS